MKPKQDEESGREWVPSFGPLHPPRFFTGITNYQLEVMQQRAFAPPLWTSSVPQVLCSSEATLLQVMSGGGVPCLLINSYRNSVPSYSVEEW